MHEDPTEAQKISDHVSALGRLGAEFIWHREFPKIEGPNIDPR